MRNELIRIWEKHGQIILNALLFGVLLRYFITAGTRDVVAAWYRQDFDFVRVAFFGHNLVMCAMILIRRQHQAVDRNFFRQAVSLFAFFSGALFLPAPARNILQIHIAQGIIIAAAFLGIICLFNLGRNFGILIAIRRVETRGLYSIIRHPMYFVDILWRAGMTLRNPLLFNLAVFVPSTAAYVYRALLEERFLSKFEEYRAYMRRVRFRFIPGLF